MRRAVIALALLITLGSCRFIPGTQANEIAEAQKAVRYRLNDPDAGQFRNDRVIGRMVCGEVNAKNRLGAYTGFRPYAYIVKTREVRVLLDPDGSNEAALAALDFPPDCRS